MPANFFSFSFFYSIYVVQEPVPRYLLLESYVVLKKPEFNALLLSYCSSQQGLQYLFFVVFGA